MLEMKIKIKDATERIESSENVIKNAGVTK